MKKSISYLGLVVLAFNFLSGTVLARSLTVENDSLVANTPRYIRISAGNHLGCPDLKKCVSHHYQIAVTSSNAKMTLAKEIMIGSDEKLENSSKDNGVPADSFDLDFSTPFYKGAILKLFPDDAATTDDLLTIRIRKDNLTEQTYAIPYLLLSPDSLNILATADQVDAKYSGWNTEAGQVKVQVLFLGTSKDEFASSFRHKLMVMEKLLIMENYLRGYLLGGKTSNLTYLELQSVWDLLWNNIQFSGEQAGQFVARYNKLKFRFNRGQLKVELLVGNVKRLLQNMQWQNSR